LGSVQASRFAGAIPSWARPFVYTLRLDQYWGLFAPTPIKNDGWLVLEAELYDQTRIDVLRDGRPLTLDKPAYISAEYPDWKWQKLEANLAEDSGKLYRVPFGDYLCRSWSERQTDPSKKIRSWVLYNMLEVTLPHFYAITPQQQELARNNVFTE
jgi:hypothetical protein